MLKLPRKKKKAFLKWASNIKSITINPLTISTTTKDAVIKSLYNLYINKHKAKTIFSCGVKKINSL